MGANVCAATSITYFGCYCYCCCKGISIKAIFDLPAKCDFNYAFVATDYPNNCAILYSRNVCVGIWMNDGMNEWMFSREGGVEPNEMLSFLLLLVLFWILMCHIRTIHTAQRRRRRRHRHFTYLFTLLHFDLFYRFVSIFFAAAAAAALPRCVN